MSESRNNTKSLARLRILLGSPPSVIVSDNALGLIDPQEIADLSQFTISRIRPHSHHIRKLERFKIEYYEYKKYRIAIKYNCHGISGMLLLGDYHFGYRP